MNGIEGRSAEIIENHKEKMEEYMANGADIDQARVLFAGEIAFAGIVNAIKNEMKYTGSVSKQVRVAALVGEMFDGLLIPRLRSGFDVQIGDIGDTDLVIQGIMSAGRHIIVTHTYSANGIMVDAEDGSAMGEAIKLMEQIELCDSEDDIEALVASSPILNTQTTIVCEIALAGNLSAVGIISVNEKTKEIEVKPLIVFGYSSHEEIEKQNEMRAMMISGASPKNGSKPN